MRNLEKLCKLKEDLRDKEGEIRQLIDRAMDAVTRRPSSQAIAWIINVFNHNFTYCFLTGELQTNSACLNLYQTAQEITTELRKPMNL